ncbi:hypothetical protein FYJ24_05055 [Actinomycetaceae bacterium WB03_NA08]|uniref:Uncharacterized protein n=1 Tax=Scrofimicrobium canadense TaxID=2652290 RepID=A0A6N7VQY0_9ACTO|nr:hypothetical protein [Scrofimicrobium canadense]MSS84144.1 hypothetical protein [Scrofimicrobium canadense]
MTVASFTAQLHKGMPVERAAAVAGISHSLGEIIVDDMRRRGLLVDATSLCASGLGMCHGAQSPQAHIACSGCPLANA